MRESVAEVHPSYLSSAHTVKNPKMFLRLVKPKMSPVRWAVEIDLSTEGAIRRCIQVMARHARVKAEDLHKWCIERDARIEVTPVEGETIAVEYAYRTGKSRIQGEMPFVRRL